MDEPKTKSVAIHIRIPKALDKELDEIAEQTGRTKQELMRLVIELGLTAMKTNDYDLPAAYLSANTTKQFITTALDLLSRTPVSQLSILKAAEEEREFKVTPKPSAIIPFRRPSIPNPPNQ